MKRASTTHKKNINKKVVTEIKEKNNFFKQNTKYVFLALMLITIFADIYNLIQNTPLNEELLISKLLNVLIIPTIFFGILSLSFEKVKIIKLTNNIFSEKPDYKISFFQKIKSVFSKNHIVSSLIFILIIIISVFTLFYKLDNFDIYSDEVQVTKAAAGYLYTGEFYQWDFVKEEITKSKLNRAKPHLFSVAMAYKMFGVNTWAARFPSALFSILLIIIMFFVGKYFVKDKTSVFLVMLSLALYFDFLSLGRWSRMYAMVSPIFLLSFYWAHKLVTEKSQVSFFNSNTIFQKFFNFNYIYIVPFIIFAFFNLNIHINSTLIFVILLFFLIISIPFFPKEKKYMIASTVGLLMLLFQVITEYKFNYSWFTNFGVDKSIIYTKILFAYPFSSNTNIIILLVSFSSLFFIKSTAYKKSFLLLFSTIIVTFILFSYIIDYPSHFRYISFIAPISILLIISSFVYISKFLYNKYIQTFIVLLIILSIAIHYKNNYNNLYITNKTSPAKPSVAHKTVVENHKKGEVIFQHYGPKMYLKGINKSTKFIDIVSSKGPKSFSVLFEQIKLYKSGWIIWHSYNSWNVDKNLINYANLFFKKYNGRGIDDTGEEIFYFNESMIHSTEEFAIYKNLPVANLSINNSYSIAFSLETSLSSNGEVFSFKNDLNSEILIFEVKKDTFFVKNNSRVLLKLKITGNKHNIVWFQKNNNKKLTHGLFYNGNFIKEKDLNIKTSLYKFMINPTYRGNIDKIRLYDFVLNKNEVKEIIIDNNFTKSSEILKYNENEFKTMYLWQKK